MVEVAQRSYLREMVGPRVVDSGNPREKQHRSGARRSKDGESREKHRSNRSDSQRSPKKESGHRRKTSNPQPVHIETEKPSLELDVIGQPATVIQLGMPVEKSVMISLKVPSPDHLTRTNNMDTSRLFAVTSLVADTRNGELVPLDPGSLSTQKTFDSVHPIPEHCVDTLARNDPCRLALGYFSFPGLVIRQAGVYRIRTTLVKMSASGETGATSLVVDSDPIKVERRCGGGSQQRRHHRSYN